MGFQKIFISILSLLSLLSVAACDPSHTSLATDSTSDSNSEISGNSEIGLAQGDVHGFEELPSPAPATPSPGPAPAQNPSNPVQANPWGSDIQIDTSRLQPGGNLTVVTANPSSHNFGSFDQTLSLDKVFNVTPMLGRLGNGPSFELDPLGGIHPQEAGASAHFYRASPILAGAENYLEVQFNVVYNSRIQYNDTTGFYDTFYPVNWLEFELLACQANGHCRSVEANIPSQVTSGGSCFSNAPSCEKSFHTKIAGTQLPGGGVEHSDYYKIVVKGTHEADLQEENGYRLCAVSDDCTMSHPYCDAGVCSAVTRDDDYFRVDTPPALRGMN